MYVYRITFLKGYSQGSFGNKNRIFLSENLCIMPTYNTLITGIYYFNIVGSRSKTPISVKVNAISIKCSALVIYSRVFYKITGIFSSVIKTTLTIHSTGVTYYGRWAVEVTSTRLRIKIKLLRVYSVFWVYNLYITCKLVVFLLCVIPSNSTS